jgi:hypothetical protein
LYIEEFGPTFFYVKGVDNNLADFLSWLRIAEGKAAPGPYGPAQVHKYASEEDAMESMFMIDTTHSPYWRLILQILLHSFGWCSASRLLQLGPNNGIVS